MPRPCLLDASLLIALGKTGHLSVLRKTRTYEWHIASLARSELVKPTTRGPVEQMILDGTIRTAEPDSDDEHAFTLFAHWSRRVDAGEAETIALALSLGWLAGLEDLAAQRKLDREVGRGHWINCADVLIAATKEGSLPLADADAIFRSLDVFSGYAKRGIRSLRDLGR